MTLSSHRRDFRAIEMVLSQIKQKCLDFVVHRKNLGLGFRGSALGSADLGLLFTGYVTLGKVLTFTRHQFPHLCP